MEPVAVLQTFGKVRRLLNARLSQKLRKFELGPTQGILLRTIRRLEKCSLAELSRETLTDPAATGKTIESLIRQGWVKKQEHPSDRRQWIVSLTQDGQRITGELDSAWEDVAEELVEAFSRKECSEFHRLLLAAEETLEIHLKDIGKSS